MTLMVSLGKNAGIRKDTANNLMEVPEAVIHIPTIEFHKKMVLSSADFPEKVNEAEVCKLNMVDSMQVKPKRIESTKIAMECKVVDHRIIGNEPNDVFFFEVLCIHADDAILDKHNTPATVEFEALGRMGHGDYTIASQGVETLPRPANAEDALNGANWQVTSEKVK